MGTLSTLTPPLFWAVDHFDPFVNYWYFKYSGHFLVNCRSIRVCVLNSSWYLRPYSFLGSLTNHRALQMECLYISFLPASLNNMILVQIKCVYLSFLPKHIFHNIEHIDHILAVLDTLGKQLIPPGYRAIFSFGIIFIFVVIVNFELLSIFEDTFLVLFVSIY